jgi:hypothetical protein
MTTTTTTYNNNNNNGNNNNNILEDRVVNRDFVPRDRMYNSIL